MPPELVAGAVLPLRYGMCCRPRTEVCDFLSLVDSRKGRKVRLLTKAYRTSLRTGARVIGRRQGSRSLRAKGRACLPEFAQRGDVRVQFPGFARDELNDRMSSSEDGDELNRSIACR